MSIYVIRHGQTDYNVRNVYQGRMDVPLNDVGVMQAKELAQKFKSLNVQADIILVSPLSRAQETARYLSEEIGVMRRIEVDLIERDFGKMEGMPNREDCNIKMLLDFDKNYNIFGVEPIQDLFKRVYKCMDKIVDKYKDKNVVIVTHAGVAQAIHCYFKGMPIDNNLESIALKNCEIRCYR